MKRTNRILHDLSAQVNDKSIIFDNIRYEHRDPIVDYNGGCQPYEDPLDYVRLNIRGTVIA